ncbi:MAG: 2-hydroxyacid dehydrogenase [Acidobacteria bacterium]|nr:2-hydroxyacid dehydrogenase [Acidobacteriota bacterium]
MTTPEILALGPLSAPLTATLEQTYTVHHLWQAPDREALLAAVGPRIRAAATTGHIPCPPALLDALPNLRLLASFGVGYDAIDVPLVTSRGVTLTNTPDVLNDAVAEITIGMMIALAREILPADRHVREGRWPSGNYPLTAQLTGSRVGILGLGRIGKRIADLCAGFRMEIAYHGRRAQPDQPHRYYGDLVEMAGAVDWLVLIAPSTPETVGLVNRRVLEALGPRGRLVNVARGNLVDEVALVDLLVSGRLGGAALDVFVDEPRVPDALFGLKNVVLQPHQGSATHVTRRAMGDLVAKNIAAFFAGEPLLTPVNR